MVDTHKRLACTKRACTGQRGPAPGTVLGRIRGLSDYFREQTLSEVNSCLSRATEPSLRAATMTELEARLDRLAALSLQSR